MNKEKIELKRLTVELRRDILNRLKLIALYKDKTVSEIVRRALYSYIRKYERSQLKNIT